MIAFLNGFFITLGLILAFFGVIIAIALLGAIHPLFAVVPLVALLCAFGGMVYKDLQ